MSAAKAPDRGDLVWLDFDPQAGHEQRGRRPAFVVSPRAYNGAAGLALCCPITSRVKGYPFEVALPSGGPIAGVILADQIKCLDWKARKLKRAGRAPNPVTAEVLGKLATLTS
jgi:mRNA interferase MazF